MKIKFTLPAIVQNLVIILLTFSSLGNALAQSLERVWDPPVAGTFYSWKGYPALPFALPGLEVYQWSKESAKESRFLVDDRNYDYNSAAQKKDAADSSSSMDEGGNNETLSQAYEYPSGSLYLEMLTNTVTSDWSWMNLNGSVANQYYDILSKTDLN